ncbi:MAG: hypothetical protein NZ853_06635 [Leptospiraceae bacterium]|nr:hypothetical protein [Leptospiraceae bacterium]
MNLKILNYKKIDWFSVVFPFIIIVYGLLIVINANFSAIDDYVFVDNLLKGKPLPIDSFVLPEVGRFFPLLGFEYNFVALFSTSPYFFFGFNSIQFFIVVYLIYYLLKDYIKDKKVIFFVILILIFLPSFVSSWHRLLLSERNVFFLLILFLIFFLKYQKDQKPLYIILSLIFANIALYYKEPVFLMLGSFAFFHLLFGWKELNPKQKLLDYLLIVSSFIFIVLYFFIVYINKGETPYGATEAQWILNFLKNSFRYSMYEPIIFFIILPAIILRIHEILILKEKKPDIFHDSLLFSTFFYFFLFVYISFLSKVF